MCIDELIDQRADARLSKNWKLSDEIRNTLDKELVFIFDASWGQEIYYLTQKYFDRKPVEMTNREYLKLKISEDIRLEKLFQSWLYSITDSLKR